MITAIKAIILGITATIIIAVLVTVWQVYSPRGNEQKERGKEE